MADNGFRGGFGTNLTTVNLMDNPGEQNSLSEDFREGVGMAHRQLVGVEHDLRNFRRTAAVTTPRIK